MDCLLTQLRWAWRQIRLHVFTVWSCDPAKLAQVEVPAVNYVKLHRKPLSSKFCGFFILKGGARHQFSNHE